MEHEVLVIPIIDDAIGTIPSAWKRETGDQSKNRDHSDDCTVKISRETYKNLGETWGDFVEKLPWRADVYHSQRVK